MLLLILLALVVLAILGGFVVSKLLFLLIVVALVVFVFSRMGHGSLLAGDGTGLRRQYRQPDPPL